MEDINIYVARDGICILFLIMSQNRTVSILVRMLQMFRKKKSSIKSGAFRKKTRDQISNRKKRKTETVRFWGINNAALSKIA